ncbi:hypothetical protein [Burkholderia gladioli]|uniref:hypothetical protein n=1 Tax=Burkholderia gladioli TaxID=28095 RepID=UPI001FC7CE76|nr:hypothetical protein [Burkholderia gladioli]
MGIAGNGAKVGALDLRLANLRADGALALGAEIDGRIVNITRAGRELNLPAPADIDDLIQNGLADQVRAIVERVRSKGGHAGLEAADVVFAPLVTRPRKSSAWASTIRRMPPRQARRFPRRRRCSPSTRTPSITIAAR